MPGSASTWLTCDLQGLHCAACVTVIEATFRSQPGASEITINPALGSAALLVDPALFSLDAFARALEPMGYRIGAARKPDVAASRSLLMRMGICFALAGNSMVCSFAIYFGLPPSERTLFLGVGFVNFGLAILSLLIGGTYFLSNAWHAIRARVWHIDIPLALSVVLAFGGATWMFFATDFGATYFDTFTAFIALMLLGKYAPARMIERNRATLLEDDGIAHLPQSRLHDGATERITADAITTGDALVFAPGDLVTVAVELSDADATCSLDWITGEPQPVRFVRGEKIPAGAFNVGDRAFVAVAREVLADSTLSKLLSGRPNDRAANALATFSRVFVIGALAAGAVTFAAWSFVDVSRGLWAAASVLIVACPCAIGLATPLAREMATRRLRMAGVFVRSERALEGLASIDTIVFDKTGTLTEIAPSRPAELDALTGIERTVLAAMVGRSNHPVARALRQSLVGTRQASCDVREIAGVGLEATFSGAVYRLRSSRGTEGHVIFEVERDGSHDLLADVTLDEHLRNDAIEEITRLRTDGFRLAILSGDRRARVEAVATRLGVAERAAELKPEEKATWLREHGGTRALVLGDGINDVPAFAAAACSGTPAIDRPFVPGKADFYYRAAGLRPIREAIGAGRAYARAVRFNYGFALVYNAIVLGAAAAGVMSPLIAAIVMPTSSLLVVLCNVWIMRHTWKSS